MVDVSHNIFYDQQRSDNFFLQMVNACVSHELRNPLNSISAQNMEKMHLYQELLSLAHNQQIDSQELRGRIKDIVGMLKEGNIVQDSSTNMMKSLV